MKKILDQLYWGELDQSNLERKKDETLEKAMQSVYAISDRLLGRGRKGRKSGFWSGCSIIVWMRSLFPLWIPSKTSFACMKSYFWRG